MKFRVTFKTPDALDDTVHEVVQSTIPPNVHFIDVELNEELQDRGQELKTFAEKWIRYGEYVTIEFDTDAKTCVVVEAE